MNQVWNLCLRPAKLGTAILAVGVQVVNNYLLPLFLWCTFFKFSTWRNAVFGGIFKTPSTWLHKVNQVKIPKINEFKQISEIRKNLLLLRFPPYSSCVQVFFVHAVSSIQFSLDFAIINVCMLYASVHLVCLYNVQLTASLHMSHAFVFHSR